MQEDSKCVWYAFKYYNINETEDEETNNGNRSIICFYSDRSPMGDNV